MYVCKSHIYVGYIYKYVETYYLNIYMYLHRLYAGTNNRLQSMMRGEEIVLNCISSYNAI